jgi:hypothetical protein
MMIPPMYMDPNANQFMYPQLFNNGNMASSEPTQFQPAALLPGLGQNSYELQNGVYAMQQPQQMPVHHIVIHT